MHARTSLRARLGWVFIGTGGIRAGWSILIFLLLMALPLVALSAVLRHVFHIQNKPDMALLPGRLIVREAISIVFIALATAIMARIERRPFWSYNLSLHRVGANLLTGWAGGFLCLSALVGLLAAFGALVFDGVAIHGAAAIAYAALWLAAFALVGLSEEALFRGYILAALTRGMGFWPAAILSSLLFGLAHVPNKGETALGLAGVVGAGLTLCIVLWETGSLWMSIGFHAAWDWAQTYLYGTPDSGMLAAGHLFVTHAAGDPRLSGGLAGPEGSLLAAPVMIAGLLALVLLARRAPRLPASGAAIPAAQGMT